MKLKARIMGLFIKKATATAVQTDPVLDSASTPTVATVPAPAVLADPSVMKAAIKHSFAFAPKPAKAVGSGITADAEELEVVQNPIFLQLGSVSGCTYKDALAYTRGLADGMFPSPESVKFRIFEDKMNDRFVYELHDGGPGLSVAEKILDALSVGEVIHIELANGYQASIEEAHGEIFTLRFPPPSEQLVPGSGDVDYIDRTNLRSITAFTEPKKLQCLVSDQSILRPIGLTFLAVSTGVLILCGGLWVALKSQVLDGDFVLSQAKLGVVARVLDNPVLHLDRARAEADTQNKTIHKLHKAPGQGWSHELK